MPSHSWPNHQQQKCHLSFRVNHKLNSPCHLRLFSCGCHLLLLIAGVCLQSGSHQKHQSFGFFLLNLSCFCWLLELLPHHFRAGYCCPGGDCWCAGNVINSSSSVSPLFGPVSAAFVMVEVVKIGAALPSPNTFSSLALHRPSSPTITPSCFGVVAVDRRGCHLPSTRLAWGKVI